MFHLVDFYPLFWAFIAVTAAFILVVLDIMESDKELFELRRSIELRKKLNRSMRHG